VQCAVGTVIFVDGKARYFLQVLESTVAAWVRILSSQPVPLNKNAGRTRYLTLWGWTELSLLSDCLDSLRIQHQLWRAASRTAQDAPRRRARTRSIRRLAATPDGGRRAVRVIGDGSRGFLRIVTNATIFNPPTPIDVGIAFCQRLID
jgi:hypothetical protein